MHEFLQNVDIILYNFFYFKTSSQDNFLKAVRQSTLWLDPPLSNSQIDSGNVNNAKI